MSQASTGLKIWGRKNSINVMKVLWCCEELGLPFRREDVGGPYGGTDTPEYLAMNPNARVPTIDDNGFILWESNVCVRYLSYRYGHPGLFPEDAHTRWRAEQWMDWMQTALHVAMTPMFWQLVRTPEDKRDPALIEKSRKETAAALTLLDGHLARNPYVAGDAFTMGDIPAGCATYRWFAFEGIERPELPHLRRWYEGLTERDGYRTHVMQPLT